MTGMTTAPEVQHRDGIEAIGPRIDGVKWRYYSGFYDGPLSGMVVLPDGREAWAACIEQCECPRYDDDTELTDEEADAVDDEPSVHGFWRRYQLGILSSSQAAEEAERHADFRAYVGHHTDIGDDGKRQLGATHPQSEHHRFYEKWSKRPSIRIEDAEPIGWWER